METIKTHWNSVMSTSKARYCTDNIFNMYLCSTLADSECVISLSTSYRPTSLTTTNCNPLPTTDISMHKSKRLGTASNNQVKLSMTILLCTSSNVVTKRPPKQRTYSCMKHETSCSSYLSMTLVSSTHKKRILTTSL